MSEEELVVLDYDEIVADTERAILFRMGEEEDLSSSVWIPKSVIREMDEEAKEVTVVEWFANRAGLI